MSISSTSASKDVLARVVSILSLLVASGGLYLNWSKEQIENRDFLLVACNADFGGVGSYDWPEGSPQSKDVRETTTPFSDVACDLTNVGRHGLSVVRAGVAGLSDSVAGAVADEIEPDSSMLGLPLFLERGQTRRLKAMLVMGNGPSSSVRLLTPAGTQYPLRFRIGSTGNEQLSDANMLSPYRFRFVTATGVEAVATLQLRFKSGGGF